MFADDDEESDEASVAKVSPLSMTAAIMLLLLSVFMNAKDLGKRKDPCAHLMKWLLRYNI